MKKSITVMLSAITTATVLLAGCSSNGTSSGDKKLTVWITETFSKEADQSLKDRITQFGKEKNIQVTVESIPQAQLDQKYSPAIESKTTPDVGFLTLKNIKLFTDKGLLTDLSQLTKDIEKESGPFFAPQIKFSSTDGKNYGIPIFNSSTVMIYRKDLLAKAGYNAPPKTWEEFRDAAKKITDLKTGVFGAGLDLGKNDDNETEERSLIWSYGGEFNSSDGKKVTFNNPNTVKAVQMVADMFNVDKSIPPASVTWDSSGNNKAYLTGQVAMIFNPPTVIPALKDADAMVRDNTAMAVVPAGAQGIRAVGGTSYFGVFKNSKQQEMSKELLRYLLNKDWYNTYIAKVAPVLAPVLQDLQKDPLWQKPENKAPIDSVANYAYIGYPGPNSVGAADVWGQYIVSQMYQRILVDKLSVDAAVKEAAASMEKVYAGK